MRHQGRIVRWDDARGFGFIKWHGGGEAEVFAHISAFNDRQRQPREGDVVAYEAGTDQRGRPVALSIEYAIKAAPATARARERNHRPPPQGRSWPGLVLLAVIAIGASSWFMQRPQVASPDIASPAVPVAPANPAQPAPSPYRCEGKQHCSQMSSCAEARFYLAHCPGTVTDGDSDGIPCEDQHCGH